MGSKPSKARRLTLVRTKRIVTPSVPQEIVDEILDHLAADFDFRSLKLCALVSRSWVPSCRRHLFRIVVFTTVKVARWRKRFPVPEESPAHHVRDLHFSIGGYHCAPEKFAEHTPWFTNVERLILSELGAFQPLWRPSSWRLPQSVTSLTVEANTITLVQIRDIMMQLPDLDNLSLLGSLPVGDRRTLLGTETVLRGRFSGRLRLVKGYAAEEVMNMLLDIPTGLRFTEVQICGMRECFFSTVRLAEACAKTLVKLSYTTSFHYGSGNPDRSFDFSMFPNLQEVDFGIGWMGGGLHRIPVALSTLRPTTSPHLSTVQLSFVRPHVINQSFQAVINDAGDDLRSVAGEASRIEHEFEGAVGFIVLRDPVFKAAFDALDILQRSESIPLVLGLRIIQMYMQ